MESELPARSRQVGSFLGVESFGELLPKGMIFGICKADPCAIEGKFLLIQEKTSLHQTIFTCS